MNAPASLAVGTRIDERYELLEPLLDRGTGEVWSARDGNFKNRNVAVKFLRRLDARLTAAPDDLARHLKALRSLRHPNLLATVNQGIWQSRPYVIQELFVGDSLGTGLDRARASGVPLPLPLVRALFDRVCAGVEAGHQAAPQPVLHLGLGPGCVLYQSVAGADVDVRVIDQGLAAWADSPRDIPPRSARGFHAPAPEQFSPGVVPGPAADVFALSALLREMVSSAGGSSPPRPDVPEAMLAVIDQGSRPDPAARFPSVAALRAAAREAWSQPVKVRAVSTADAAGAPRASVPRDAPPDLGTNAMRSGTAPPRAMLAAGPMPPLAAPVDDVAFTLPLQARTPAAAAWNPPVEPALAGPADEDDDLGATLNQVAPQDGVDDQAATSHYAGPQASQGAAAYAMAMAAARSSAVVRRPTLAPAPHRPPPSSLPVSAPGVTRPPSGVARTVLAVAVLVLGLAVVTGLVLVFFRVTHPG